MDTSLIYQALEEPALRKQIPLAELERIQAAYPYFTAAQVLLAKIYQENKDHRYADQLQQAALYAIDRKVLSAYMREVEPVTDLIDLEQDQEPEVIVNSELEEHEPVVSVTTEAEESVVVEVEEEIVVEQIEEKIEENELVEEIVAKAEVKEEEEVAEIVEEIVEKALEEESEQAHIEKPEMSDFDREILIEAVHSSLELEIGEEDLLEESSSEVAADSNNEVNPEIERIMAKDPSELTFGEMMMLKAAKMGEGENGRMGKWGNEEMGEGENGEMGEEDENEEVGKWGNGEREEDRARNFDYLYKLHNGGLAPLDAKSEKEKQKNIIDRFIKLEPKITPGKVSEYNTASNLAKESLEEDFSFATETMAKLFIAQGKFDKAKKVYRKLIELHPEKNVYFAAQLKNLNQNKKQ